MMVVALRVLIYASDTRGSSTILTHTDTIVYPESENYQEFENLGATRPLGPELMNFVARVVT